MDNHSFNPNIGVDADSLRLMAAITAREFLSELLSEDFYRQLIVNSHVQGGVLKLELDFNKLDPEFYKSRVGEFL